MPRNDLNRGRVGHGRPAIVRPEPLAAPREPNALDLDVYFAEERLRQEAAREMDRKAFRRGWAVLVACIAAFWAGLIYLAWMMAPRAFERAWRLVR